MPLQYIVFLISFYYPLPSAYNHDIFISKEAEKSVQYFNMTIFYLHYFLNERNITIIYSQSQPEQGIDSHLFRATASLPSRRSSGM